MSRIVYVNGEYLPGEQGKVSIFDRGFLFADGVYEVSAVLRGRLVDNEAHLARLHRSLSELQIPQPVSDAEIVAAQRQLVERNNLNEGLVYLQISRGPAERDFAFPAEPAPTLVMFTQQLALIESPMAEQGIAILTVRDMRWKRRDIKTIGGPVHGQTGRFGRGSGRRVDGGGRLCDRGDVQQRVYRHP